MNGTQKLLDLIFNLESSMIRLVFWEVKMMWGEILNRGNIEARPLA